ncbi:MAG: hypothetical protein ACXAB9_15665, partial [Candidatus Thorarchaeota archaeon]
MAAIDEITLPGGMCVFFTETGGAERQLGNIVGDSLSIDRDSDEIEHFTNKSGIRRKDKIFTIEENAQLDFELDEINVETLAGEAFVSVEKPGLTAVTVRQFVDNVFLDDNGTFLDHSVEADTAGGTAFTGVGEITNDHLYIGKKTQFAEVDFDIDTAGSYTGIAYEYWNGTIWTALIGLTDNTSGQSVDGTVVHTPQANWAQTTVNAVSQYWIRINVATTVTTPATYFSIGRQALVEGTDHEVDPGAATGVSTTKNGAIRRVAAGALVDGEEVKTSFTYVTFTSQTFGIAEQSNIEGSARLLVAPQAGRGTSWQINIPRCQLKNNGSMDLDDSDFQTIPLSIVVLDNSSVDTT